MSITLNSIKCPDCGANLSVEEGRDSFFCSYCGSQIKLTNENEHIIRHIDEADIARAETDRMVRIRKLSLEEDFFSNISGIRKLLLVVWILLSLAIIAVCIVEMSMDSSYSRGFRLLFFLGVPVIGGGAYLLFKILPEKERDRKLLMNGGVIFPEGAAPFKEQYFEAFEAMLRNSGFTNITGINMHDMLLGIFIKPGKVEKVTVDGTEIFTGGKIYPADVPIVVMYHGR